MSRRVLVIAGVIVVVFAVVIWRAGGALERWLLALHGSH